MKRVPWFAATLALAACVAEPPAAPPAIAPLSLAPPAMPQREEFHTIPIAGSTSINARLCRPDQPGPVPLAVINHGSPANAAQRATTRPAACESEAVTWFTARGFAVLLPLRRGYGISGGEWAEAYGRCGDADFAAAGRATARDIRAAIDHATRLPGIRPQGVLVVGQSAGGWGALALASENPPQVAAIVNMAGGRGGWAQQAPNTNCRPDRLVSGAGEYGRTARLPTLWLYTANDSFFGPALAAEMHRAYGGTAQFVPLPAWGQDGHSLFFGRGGSATWGPVVEPFLRTHGYAARSN